MLLTECLLAISNELPTPQRVIQDIQGTSETDTALRQCTALDSLMDEIFLLEYPHGDGGSPLPPKAFTKLKAYYDAKAQISCPGAELIQFEVTEEGKKFQRKVLQKYLSQGTLAAAEAAAKAKRAHNEAEAAASGNAAKVHASTPGTWEAFLQGFKLITVGLLILTLIVALRNESGPRLDVDAKEALRLPDALRRINVFRKEYDVSCQSGKLFAKELWTETNVTTTTSGGGVYQSGGTVHSTPVTTSTHVSSTVYHRFWLRSPDGRESWRRFSGDEFSGTAGQVISTIGSGTTVLMAYNHSTGQFATGRSWFGKLHKLPMTRWSWMALGVAVVFLLWNVRTVMANLDTFFDTLKFGAIGVFLNVGWTCFFGIVWVGAMWIVWAIPAAIFSAIITTTRNRQFEKRVVPAFRRFLKESTPELLARFRALPT